MVSIDENRLKGNYAELVTSSWLSRSCLVRPVVAGTDIGIDLYCESVVDNSPYLHFWAQVKTISLDVIKQEDDEQVAFFDFETKHLRYWQKQPIPVYAFLVPLEEWQPNPPKRIFGVRLTEHLVKRGVSQQKYTRIKSSGYFDESTIDGDVSQFVKEIVPWDNAALLMQKGLVAPIEEPTAESDYPKFPLGIGFPHLEKIYANLRDAASGALRDALAKEQMEAIALGLPDIVNYDRNDAEKLGKLDPSKMRLRKKFERILGSFDEDLTPYAVSILSLSAKWDGNVEEGFRIIKNALHRAKQTKNSEETKKYKDILQEFTSPSK